jgi:DNA-binding transcriptional ArsR family regulator
MAKDGSVRLARRPAVRRSARSDAAAAEPFADIASAAAVLKALANDRRLEILSWLKDPRRHFPPQVDGDLVRDGVCGVFIARKLEVSAPTTSEHLRILTRAGLLRARRIKQWTFYRRDERRIAALKRAFRTDW